MTTTETNEKLDVEMWGPYIVRNDKAKIGLFLNDHDNIDARSELADITTEPDNPAYIRQPLPEENNERVEFDLTTWQGNLDAFFIVCGGDLLDAFFIEGMYDVVTINAGTSTLAIERDWEEIRNFLDT